MHRVCIPISKKIPHLFLYQTYRHFFSWGNQWGNLDKTATGQQRLRYKPAIPSRQLRRIHEATGFSFTSFDRGQRLPGYLRGHVTSQAMMVGDL